MAGEINNLKSNNMEIITIKEIIDNCTYISSHDGHIRANKVRNSYQIFKDKEGNHIIRMSVLKNGEELYTIFDEDDLNNIKNISWHMSSGGYVQGRPNKVKLIYLHHLITKFKSSGKGFQSESIDHINRNPLDNRKKNLRLATAKEQQQNSKGQLEGTKRNRKHNARKLPEGINELPKYVVYYLEKCSSKAATLPDNPEQGYRDFFRIEKHPSQLCNPPLFKNKWATSKGMLNITPQDKLNQAIKKLEEMNSEYQTKILDKTNNIKT